jgi:hypothetical protein
MADNVDNTLLEKLLRDIRKELGENTALLQQSINAHQRLERRLDGWTQAADHRAAAVDERIASIDVRIGGIDTRISGLKDDLELMLKSELKGALGNFETRIEHLIEERLAKTD